MDSRLAEMEKLLANGLKFVCRLNVMFDQEESPDVCLLTETIYKGNKYRDTIWKVSQGGQEMWSMHTFDGCYFQVYSNQTNQITIAKNRKHPAMWRDITDPTVMFFYLNTEPHVSDSVSSISLQTVLQHLGLYGDTIRPGLSRGENGAWEKLGPLDELFADTPKYTVYFSDPSSLWPSKLVKEIRDIKGKSEKILPLVKEWRIEVINKGHGSGNGFEHLFPKEIDIISFCDGKRCQKYIQIVEEVTSMPDVDDSLFKINPQIAHGVVDLEINESFTIKTR
jgi:hypothetical protein